MYFCQIHSAEATPSKLLKSRTSHPSLEIFYKNKIGSILISTRLAGRFQ